MGAGWLITAMALAAGGPTPSTGTTGETGNPPGTTGETGVTPPGTTGETGVTPSTGGTGADTGGGGSGGSGGSGGTTYYGDTGPIDTGEPPHTGTCGCGTAAPALAWLALPALLVVRRRR